MRCLFLYAPSFLVVLTDPDSGVRSPVDCDCGTGTGEGTHDALRQARLLYTVAR